MKFEISNEDLKNVVMGGLYTGHGPFVPMAGQRVKSVRTVGSGGGGVGGAPNTRKGRALIELEVDPDYVPEPEIADEE